MPKLLIYLGLCECHNYKLNKLIWDNVNAIIIVISGLCECHYYKLNRGYVNAMTINLTYLSRAI